MKWLNCYRMKVVFVSAIMLGGGSSKADFTWARKTDMPIQRYQHSASAVGVKIYVIGG